MQAPSAAAQRPLQRTGRVCFLDLTPVLVLNVCIQKGAGVSSGLRWIRRFSWNVFSAFFRMYRCLPLTHLRQEALIRLHLALHHFLQRPPFTAALVTKLRCCRLPCTFSSFHIWNKLTCSLNKQPLDQIIQNSAASEMPAVNSCSNDGNNYTCIFDIVLILLIYAYRSSWTEDGSSTSPWSWRWLKRTSCFSSRCRGAESPGPYHCSHTRC